MVSSSIINYYVVLGVIGEMVLACVVLEFVGISVINNS